LSTKIPGNNLKIPKKYPKNTRKYFVILAKKYHPEYMIVRNYKRMSARKYKKCCFWRTFKDILKKNN